jgi:hypothetical protein
MKDRAGVIVIRFRRQFRMQIFIGREPDQAGAAERERAGGADAFETNDLVARQGERVGEQDAEFASREISDAADGVDRFVAGSASDNDFHGFNLTRRPLASQGWPAHDADMDRAAAISDIRASCNIIAGGVTSIHPLLPALADEPTKGEIIKALFELTKAVEIVKKQVMRLEKRDDSALL